MVAFLAVPRPAMPVRAGAAAFSVTFFAGAFLAVALVPGAFLAVAVAVGRRVGADVAEVSFFRATRGVVAVGFSPGLFAALAPVARFVAAATFLAVAFRDIGVPLAPVGLVTPVDRVAALFPVEAPRARSAISFLLDQRVTRPVPGRIG